MTTEVAILNKSAVALAADSAVTISAQRGDEHAVAKIYVDANKLFELVKGQPVGVMIYNGANIAGVPWETLIKAYRTDRPRVRFDTLEAYADDFVAFVGQALSPFLSPSDEYSQLEDIFTPLVQALYSNWVDDLRAIQGRIARRDRLRELIQRAQSDTATEPICQWAQGLDEHRLWRDWQHFLIGIMPDTSEELTLTGPVRSELARLSLAVFLRVGMPFGSWSGLVISGFGDREFFPTVCAASIGGFVAGRIVKVDSSVDQVSNDRPALIQPYAQKSEALMFLQGIDPQVSRAVSSFWRRWSEDLEDDVVAIIKRESQVTPVHLDAIKARLSSHFKSSWNGFSQFMDEEFHRKRLEPIEASASFLSKGEIADLAENLVDLSSLRNRVSLDRQETVGGATDVAVISKGDGFVWVKRKHYFDRDRNPAWALRQVLTDVVVSQQGDVGSESGEV